MLIKNEVESQLKDLYDLFEDNEMIIRSVYEENVEGSQSDMETVDN